MAVERIPNNVLPMQLGLLKDMVITLSQENPDPELIERAIALSGRITDGLKERQQEVLKVNSH